jgi:hypothetical protein
MIPPIFSRAWNRLVNSSPSSASRKVRFERSMIPFSSGQCGLIR